VRTERSSSGRSGPLPILGLALLIVVTACTVLLGQAWTGPHAATPAASVTDASSTTPDVTPASSSRAPSAPAVTMTSVAAVATPAVLTSTLAQLGVAGTVSVAAYDLTDGDELTAGGGTYDTASIVKVDILVSLLVQRNGSLTSAQKSLARSMITVSDNDAATTLFQTIGSTAGLNRTNKQLGLVETSAGTNGNWGLTRTTATDQLRLLKLVFVPNQVLSDASRSYVVSLMSAVSQDQHWGVSAASDDPDDTPLKNGWLQRSATALWDVTSIGRVDAHGHLVLVVVLVTSARTMGGGVSTIEMAAKGAVAKLISASGA